MPNPYFQFKQFTVHQDACAMKVCTDACLFGAWVREEVKSQKSKGKNQKEEKEKEWKILDIGAGTGLLSLMIAQDSTCNIEAVEIDEAAAAQAESNFEASPWGSRLSVIQKALQEFEPASGLYDFIISNPPFFENDLKSHNRQRNVALHSEALPLEELFSNISRLLKPDGSFALLLPFHRKQKALELAVQQGFHAQAIASVKQTPAHPGFRVMLLFAHHQSPAVTEQSITIRDEQNQYTAEFTALLKDYYLHL